MLFWYISTIDDFIDLCFQLVAVFFFFTPWDETCQTKALHVIGGRMVVRVNSLLIGQFKVLEDNDW